MRSVRLMVLSNSHIMHVFEDDEKLANFAYPPLSYLRAEVLLSSIITQAITICAGGVQRRKHH